LIYDPQEYARVRNPLLLVTAASWALLLADQSPMLMLAHGPAASCEAMPFSASLQMLLAMTPPASLAAGWALMLLAMMSPIVIPPLYYIRLRSFTNRLPIYRAFPGGLYRNLDGGWQRSTGHRTCGQLACAAILSDSGSRGSHRVSLAVLTYQAALSQSLLRLSGAVRIRCCGRF